MAFIEFTLSDVSEPIFVRASQIVLVEQKPLHSSGYVAITLVGGKEFTVIESYQAVVKALMQATDEGKIKVEGGSGPADFGS